MKKQGVVTSQHILLSFTRELPMESFNLEYYRAFYTVAQTGNVTKAAELLCLSQPAVTRSIHRLEESLGCKLFTRVSRGVRLTAEGTALFPMWTALSNLCPTANAS